MNTHFQGHNQNYSIPQNQAINHFHPQTNNHHNFTKSQKTLIQQKSSTLS